MTVFVLYLFSTALSFAQELSSPFIPIAPDVLSNSFVRCFYKDSNGYMWIGTEEGLIRYDGSNAYRYVHDATDNTTLTHSTVNAIIEGKDKQLWIGTARGLCIYSRELDSFINVDSIKGNVNYLNNRYITDLEFDNNGMLWIGTHEGGINIYDPAKRQFTYIVDPPLSGKLPSTNFISILVNVGDTIWCGSKGGLLLYDTRTKKRLPLNALERFADAQVIAVAPEKSGSLLIATVSGQITRLIAKGGRYTFQDILSGDELGQTSNRILTLALDRRGNILAGGENSGFNYVDRNTAEVTRFLADEGNTKRLPTNSVQSIYVDDAGMIWIGTLNNGAFVIDNTPKKFETREIFDATIPFTSREVRGFAEDKDGNTWVAIYGIGLGKVNPKSGVVQRVDDINRKITNKNVTSVISDKHGDLWIGTAGKGVFRITPQTKHVLNYPIRSDGFGNDQVFCLYEDRSGTIWAGTWGSGVFIYDKTTDTFLSATEYDQPGHIPNTAYVCDILLDSDGTYWVGTLYGLYELKRRGEKSFTYKLHIPEDRPGSIKGYQVQAIAEDGNKNLWVGTTEALNVKERNSGSFTAFMMDNGPVINTVRSMLPDSKGNIWIGGNSGLAKFEARSGTFVNYTRGDGLKSNNFHRKAALATSSGKFFFGSNNGFDSFYPDSIRATSTEGRIVLTDLRINNQSVRPGVADSPLDRHISLTSNLELSYEQRSFIIDFVVLNFLKSSDYSYCYKLEGFDTDWNCTGSRHSAKYTNIDPGTYVFLVKAANRDGVLLDNPLRLEITIHQVFWKTWWAFAIYITIMFLFVYLLVRIRIERLKMKSEILFEKLTREREHQLSESKTQFFTNVAHEFRTPLSLVLIPLESLMESNEVPAPFRERVYTAYKNADRMQRLVNELLDFNKLEVGNLKLHVHHGELVQFIKETSAAFNEMAAKRKIRFTMISEQPVIMGWFDREKLEGIIFNILSNAFKFTADGGEITVRIAAKKAVIPGGTLCECVELVIEDNGIGILPEELPKVFEKFYQAKSASKISTPGTGIGLSFTKALVELHHGSINAESIPDQSTIFRILLPLDASIYHVEEVVVTPPDVVYTKKTDEVLLPDPELADVEVESDKSKILVVEDNFELREYLVAELRTEFTVYEAKDGHEGLQMVGEINPDLIISDIMMPVKDGIEFCDAIKSDLGTCHIPFILLTAKATMDDQIKGINTGADLYISKPFNVRYLMAHVQQMIASRRKLYARFSQDVYLMPGKATTNVLDQDFLQRAIDYVIANLQDPQLSVDSIAGLFNLSRMQVYRKIKALTGKSVVEFIRMVRMKQAIKLMDSHKLTLSEIAFEVGFNSASYFTRCFKEEYGKTPSEYLEQS
jgi:signal transduction histidine kinase/ligand-binding sensor domain-containing protein/DNA-binding response OmpR family regulator